jgi:hypothetical protein
MGYSGMPHWLAGLDLDIIDLFGDPEIMASAGVLTATYPSGRIRLHKGRSPAGVHRMAEQQPEGWSFFMIDGDHEGDAPLKTSRRACLMPPRTAPWSFTIPIPTSPTPFST